MSLKNYRKNKEKVWMALGNKCARCGCKYDLQIDHIDPFTKKFDVTRKLSSKLGPLWEEIYKCQLLCKSCHKEKTKEDQKSIQKKRRKFIDLDYRFDPILQEYMRDICIDDSKKDGKAYVKICQFEAEKRGVDFWDIVTEHVEEVEKFQEFIALKDWDETEVLLIEGGKPMEKIQEFKDYLEEKIAKMEKEEPELYEKLYEKFKRWDVEDNEDESKCSFTKLVDSIIEGESK